jgi:hypothetical protein
MLLTLVLTAKMIRGSSFSSSVGLSRQATFFKWASHVEQSTNPVTNVAPILPVHSIHGLRTAEHFSERQDAFEFGMKALRPGNMCATSVVPLTTPS